MRAASCWAFASCSGDSGSDMTTSCRGELPTHAQSYTEVNAIPTNFRDAYPVETVFEEFA